MRGFPSKRILAVLITALAVALLAQTGVSFAQVATEKPVVKEAAPATVKKGAIRKAEPAAAPPKPAISPTTEVEIQRRFNELKRELLDNRADSIEWWLAVVAIVLTFFGIVVAIGGFFGIRIFREIVVDARKSAEDAKGLVEEIEKNREISENIVGQLTIILSSQEEDSEEDSKEQTVEFQEQGSKNEIIEAWRRIAKVAEGSDNNLAARAWFSIGYLLRQQQKYEEAIDACSEAIRLKPDLARAYNNRGSAKRQLNQYEDAIADYDEAIRLDSNYARAYNNRGSAKRQLRQYEDAIADCDEAIRLNPNYAFAYNNRGNTKRRLGQFEDAITDYDKAIRLKPDLARAYNNRGSAKRRLGQYEDAIADCYEAIRLDPDYARAYYNRGLAHLALDNKIAARSDFEKARDLAHKASNEKLATLAEQELKKLDE